MFCLSDDFEQNIKILKERLTYNSQKEVYDSLYTKFNDVLSEHFYDVTDKYFNYKIEGLEYFVHLYILCFVFGKYLFRDKAITLNLNNKTYNYIQRAFEQKYSISSLYRTLCTIADINTNTFRTYGFDKYHNEPAIITEILLLSGCFSSSHELKSSREYNSLDIKKYNYSDGIPNMYYTRYRRIFPYFLLHNASNINVEKIVELTLKPEYTNYIFTFKFYGNIVNIIEEENIKYLKFLSNINSTNISTLLYEFNKLYVGTIKYKFYVIFTYLMLYENNVITTKNYYDNRTNIMHYYDTFRENPFNYFPESFHDFFVDYMRSYDLILLENETKEILTSKFDYNLIKTYL